MELEQQGQDRAREAPAGTRDKDLRETDQGTDAQPASQLAHRGRDTSLDSTGHSSSSDSNNGNNNGCPSPTGRRKEKGNDSMCKRGKDIIIIIVCHLTSEKGHMYMHISGCWLPRVPAGVTPAESAATAATTAAGPSPSHPHPQDCRTAAATYMR